MQPQKHIPIAQLITFALIFMLVSVSAQKRLPKDEHFKVETLLSGLEDPMEIAVAPSGEVFIVERKGKLKSFSPESGKVTDVKQIKVAIRKGKKSPEDRESGLLGITLDPEFETNGWIYLYYSPNGEDYHQLSRFTYENSKLSDEKMILKVPRHTNDDVCHEAGSLAFGSDGLLYLSTGDNTNPFVSDGFAPIDERAGRAWADAQRTAGNTNDLRGKILRLRPTKDGGYEIPDGNLFPPGTEKTKPEIYVMGCRNPYRISVDPKTNFLYWAKVGPDSRKATERGPSGYDEINQAKVAGNYGWPYFSGRNEAYADYDYATKEVGEKFNPDQPRNLSPNNTGQRQLPKAVPAWIERRRSCSGVGPVYYDEMFPDSASKFPAIFNSVLFTFDWNNGRFTAVKISPEGEVEWEEQLFRKHRFTRPNDIALSPKGELYVLEYGNVWYNGNEGKLKRVTYTADPIEIPSNIPDPRLTGFPSKHTGTKLIGAPSSTCFACHQVNADSIGPSFWSIAKKYRRNENASQYLADKILNGGSGVWGAQPMPPQVQLKREEALQVADAILGVRVRKKSDGHQK